MSPGALEGVRVVDLTTTFLGPYCTMLLAELGADVIKVEAPGGDITRGVGPARSPKMAAGFMGANRGKRSVTLDLKSAAGIAALQRIVESADVFFHNMRAAAASRLGISPETVRSWNPAVVYCSSSGFGSGGVYRDRTAYDDIIQAGSGLATLQGLSTGGPPRYVATAFADKTVGLVATYSILAALYSREKTGLGQAIEVPMFENIVKSILLEHLMGATFDPPSRTMGYPRILSESRKPYETADGHVAVMVYTDAQWRRFFAWMGRPELASDERFSSIAKRTENVDELYGLVEKALISMSTEHACAVLEEMDIPHMRVPTLQDLLVDPHLESVGFFRVSQHPSEGPVVSMDRSVRFSETDGPEAVAAAPQLGQHTEEVLLEAGYSPDEIGFLREEGAFGVYKP